MDKVSELKLDENEELIEKLKHGEPYEVALVTIECVLWCHLQTYIDCLNFARS